MNDEQKPPFHIRLTSHSTDAADLSYPINWSNIDPIKRGPVIATLGNMQDRNAIGAHSGSYAVYRALAVAAGNLDPGHKADLKDTSPIVELPVQPTWGQHNKIVSLDPFGHLVGMAYKDYLEKGVDIRPSIAITRARINIPELISAMQAGRLKPDGKILKEDGEVSVVKIAIEPVWFLPGIAERFDCTEATLRQCIFEHTGGMFPELITRPDLHVFLPPIGGTTVYLFGNIEKIPDHKTELTCRVHDECNGSDVFGSDICTCRPYLTHGIELCIESAQKNGAGIIVYNRKEGRALGEVTKFLVYNARKRQKGGDRADTYFERTECVAGVQDMRFQELMPDVLNWLGATHIDRFVSMSDMKYDALVKQEIQVKERVTIPEELVPADAQVEMTAKKAAGYFTEEQLEPNALDETRGREFDQ